MFLVPQPGSKPEFLATCVPADPARTPTFWNELPVKVVLEGYTRDGWAWKPNPSFPTFPVKSVDGRNKLPGFVKYLKERQKSGFGPVGQRGVWVVSYIQSQRNANQMECRVSMDLSTIPNCPLKPKPPQVGPQIKSQTAVVPPGGTGSTTLPSANSTRKPGGLLGKLVGAQQRTNHHMISTSKTPVNAAKLVKTGSDGSDASSIPTGSVLPVASVDSGTASRTAQQVLADFRQSMQEKMLDFDVADNEEVLQITVSLAEHLAGLSTDDKAQVTMDVLKYMVYEAAEEVNDEWVAFKEPSEYMDEAIFSIYKEGAAPPEVLEEINKGELPEEIRAQQRALVAERQRLASQANSQQQRKITEQALHFDDEADRLEVLNQRKRDRRTIEDYEREKRDNSIKRR